MKRIFTVLAVSALMISFTSCNKKLKDDMSDLENSVNEEKAKNETLQGQLNSLNKLLYLDPMTYNFNTKNSADQSVSSGGTYSFGYGSNYESSYFIANVDGTYDVRVWRGADLGTDFYARIDFTYNPTTSTISNQQVVVQGFSPYGEDYNPTFSGTTNITTTVTVNSFDAAAEKISFNFSSNTTSTYTGNAFATKSMSLTASYNGKLVKKLGAI